MLVVPFGQVMPPVAMAMREDLIDGVKGRVFAIVLDRPWLELDNGSVRQFGRSDRSEDAVLVDGADRRHAIGPLLRSTVHSFPVRDPPTLFYHAGPPDRQGVPCRSGAFRRAVTQG